MKNTFYTFFFLVLSHISLAQNNSTDNYISWSSTRRLTSNDFIIKTDSAIAASSAQFIMSYEVKGIDVFSKNINKKINNQFVKSASWLNTAYDINTAVRYQQTLFDLSEVYARQFRKSLKKRKKKFGSGLKIVDELHGKAMADYASHRIKYDKETKYGTDSVKQQEWEQKIKIELEALKDFANE